MKKITLIAAAIAALGVSAQASAAFVSGPILFDIDGAGGSATQYSVKTFDWLPGNSLSKNSIGITTGDTFTTYFQATLNSLVLNAGGTVSANPGREFTVQAVINEKVVSGIGRSRPKRSRVKTGRFMKFIVLEWSGRMINLPDSMP